MRILNRIITFFLLGLTSCVNVSADSAKVDQRRQRVANESKKTIIIPLSLGVGTLVSGIIGIVLYRRKFVKPSATDDSSSDYTPEEPIKLEDIKDPQNVNQPDPLGNLSPQVNIDNINISGNDNNNTVRVQNRSNNNTFNVNNNNNNSNNNWNKNTSFVQFNSQQGNAQGVTHNNTVNVNNSSPITVINSSLDDDVINNNLAQFNSQQQNLQGTNDNNNSSSSDDDSDNDFKHDNSNDNDVIAHYHFLKNGSSINNTNNTGTGLD